MARRLRCLPCCSSTCTSATRTCSCTCVMCMPHLACLWPLSCLHGPTLLCAWLLQGRGCASLCSRKAAACAASSAATQTLGQSVVSSRQHVAAMAWSRARCMTHHMSTSCSSHWHSSSPAYPRCACMCNTMHPYLFSLLLQVVRWSAARRLQRRSAA